MEMDEKTFNAKVMKLIRKYMTDSQYGVSPIPFHEHTGTDSPQIPSTNIAVVNTGNYNPYTPYIILNIQTGTSYTPILTDVFKLVVLGNANPITVTVPPNSSVAFPVGTQIDFMQFLTGAVTFAEGSGVTIDSKDGNKVINGQFVGVTLIKLDTDIWGLFGDLTA